MVRSSITALATRVVATTADAARIVGGDPRQPRPLIDRAARHPATKPQPGNILLPA